MKRNRILLVGCGKVGLPVAQALTDTHEVFALSRSANTHHDGIHSIQADVSRAESLHEVLPERLDIVLYCLSPSEISDEGYRRTYPEGLQNILTALPEGSVLQRLYLVSSTSVYHQNDNSWVNEDSPTLPSSFAGQRILEAEKLAHDSPHPSTVVRFSGIYGGQRKRLIEQVRCGKQHLNESVRTTNRIHETDCIGFLLHLIKQPDQSKIASCYLASDSAPVDMNEVVKFIAAALGVIAQEKASSGPRRRGGNKRCDNSRMLSTGYQLRYPSYKHGYGEMLEQERSV